MARNWHILFLTRVCILLWRKWSDTETISTRRGKDRKGPSGTQESIPPWPSLGWQLPLQTEVLVCFVLPPASHDQWPGFNLPMGEKLIYLSQGSSWALLRENGGSVFKQLMFNWAPSKPWVSFIFRTLLLNMTATRTFSLCHMWKSHWIFHLGQYILQTREEHRPREWTDLVFDPISAAY